jgi:hypothetical protein
VESWVYNEAMHGNYERSGKRKEWGSAVVERDDD